MTSRPAFVAAFTMLVAYATSAHGAEPSLQDGLNAYRDNHVADAERIFRALSASPATSAEDRAGAARELGRVAWLARGDTHPIAYALTHAPAGAEACDTAILAARIFRQAQHAADIVANAAQHLTDCQGEQANELRIELARDELSVAVATRRADALQTASNYLAEVQGAATRSPDASATRFTLALRRHDANAAFAAWRDCFWLTDGDTPQGMPAYAGRVQSTFIEGLAAGASDAAVLDLLTMMARAGFLDDVRQLATETNVANSAPADQRWTRLAALLRFDADMDVLLLRTNRALMAGDAAPHFQADCFALARRLEHDAGLSGDLRPALQAAFGLYGTIGETGGFPSFHAGFVVEDDHLHVEQYGHSGDLRFVVIDNMMANGYQAWLWDGWAETGGWASDDGAIVQVRSAYTSGPLNELALSQPGPSRERFLARIATQTAQERSALANGVIASLSATSNRLELQAIDAMHAHTNGDETAFVAESWRATLQHSIFIHEGRHTLDKAVYRDAQALSDEDLEFRAKLSELALADYPRLPLSRISSLGVGDGTAHGQANARIVTAYRDWMNAHTGEITAFDAAVPALAQLDKLTDDQIRAIARSLDPWAHG